jgi:SAM-dependent methyltransferase
MQPTMASGSLQAPTPEEAAALRAVFAAAGYTDKGLVQRFGEITLPSPRTRNLPRLLYQTSGGTRGDTLARLFLFGVAVPEEAARTALDPVPLDTVRRLGLIEAREGGVGATVVLYPYGGLLFAFDRPDQIPSGARRDLVMGISTSTVDLANFTVRKPARNALDLGTGNGFQAFLAAAHSEQVCAVDFAARAVEFARFGAALNGLDKVECLEGDRFAPVRGRRFDLIVGNLPFVIAPASRYLYRDSGMQIDSFAESILRAAPEYLEEDGWCQVICEWAHVGGEDWRDRIARWFEGSGCDVWVLELSTAKPFLYADSWVRDTEPDDAAAAVRTYNEWLAFYEANRIEGISTGLIAMRRRSGSRNWLHIDDWPEHAPEGFGRHAAERFALYDFLERVGNERLLEERLIVSPEARLLSENEWAPGSWRITEARLCLSFMQSYAGKINAHVGNLLSNFDGARTLRESIARLAETLHVPFERVAEPSVPLVRQLIGRGFLMPVEMRPGA